jgi:hypothetical protein
MDYQSSLDEIGSKLLGHMDVTNGFQLSILFAAHPDPVMVLRMRAQLNFSELVLITLREPEKGDAVLHSVLSAPTTQENPAPLWLEMWQPIDDKIQWDAYRRAVWQVLANLNDHLFELQRQIARPLVLVLPDEWRASLSSMAPELWNARAFSFMLQANVEEIESNLTPLPAVQRKLSIAEVEWKLMWETVPDKLAIDPDIALEAVAAVLERSDYVGAKDLIDKLLPMLEVDEQAEVHELHHYSNALNYCGKIHLALGNQEESRLAFAESLKFRRRLQERQGVDPSSLRALGLTSHLSSVDKELASLAEARASYSESLAIRRCLRDTLEIDIQTDIQTCTQSGIDRTILLLNQYGGHEVQNTTVVDQKATTNQSQSDDDNVIRFLSTPILPDNRLIDVDRELEKIEEARRAFTEKLNKRRRQRDNPNSIA